MRKLYKIRLKQGIARGCKRLLEGEPESGISTIMVQACMKAAPHQYNREERAPPKYWWNTEIAKARHFSCVSLRKEYAKMTRARNGRWEGATRRYNGSSPEGRMESVQIRSQAPSIPYSRKQREGLERTDRCGWKRRLGSPIQYSQREVEVFTSEAS